MSIYERLGAMVTRLLEKYGQDAIWVQIQNADPNDPDKPWVESENVTVETPVRLAFMPDDRDQRETKNFTHRSTVPRGNQQIYMGPVDFEPTLKDVVKRDLDGVTITYAIESITRFRPSDAPACGYEIRLK